jgi:phage-related protein
MGFAPKALKPVEWVGSTRKDICAFPKSAKYVIGHAILYAQAGLTHECAKPMKGKLREVVEIRTEIGGEAYRAMYIAKLSGVIYALHAFQKKAPQGKKTPKHHLELIAQRLKVARQHYAETHKKQTK